MYITNQRAVLIDLEGNISYYKAKFRVTHCDCLKDFCQKKNIQIIGESLMNYYQNN